MASKPLVLSDPNMLAEFVRETEFKGLLEKRFAVPSDLAALLFRNGELVDSYKGAHFSVGGLATALKETVAGSSHIALMLADMKPFQVQLPVKALSKDQVEVVGLATLELQLNPDKPSNILGLMGGIDRSEGESVFNTSPESGRRALSRMDVLDRIAPHFADRVVEATIGRMNAVDIRGDTGLQDKLQADMMLETQRVCGDIGVLLRASSIEWAMNEAEREAFGKAQIQRQQAALDDQLEYLKREVARQKDATEIRMTAKTDTLKLENASEDEIAHMLLNSEIGLIDARDTAIRQQEMKALAHEIEMLRNHRAGQIENDLAEANHTINLANERAKLSKIERDIEQLDQVHMAELQKIGAFTELEIQERKQRMELDLAERAQKLKLANLQAMMDMENTSKDKDGARAEQKLEAETKAANARLQAEADARTQQLQAGSKMTPEQILAISAGLSPEVADVLKEQAKAKASAGEGTMDSMRELIRGAHEERAADRQHVIEVLKTGMTGASGVAHGAGGKPGSTESPRTAAESIECPKCGRTNDAKSNFCTGCGHKLRT